MNEKQHLLETTWQALKDFDLDPADSRCVNRYQKLATLWLTLAKAIAKDQAAQPAEVNDTLEF